MTTRVDLVPCPACQRMRHLAVEQGWGPVEIGDCELCYGRGTVTPQTAVRFATQDTHDPELRMVGSGDTLGSLLRKEREEGYQDGLHARRALRPFVVAFGVGFFWGALALGVLWWLRG